MPLAWPLPAPAGSPLAARRAAGVAAAAQTCAEGGAWLLDAWAAATPPRLDARLARFPVLLSGLRAAHLTDAHDTPATAGCADDASLAAAHALQAGLEAALQGYSQASLEEDETAEQAAAVAGAGVTRGGDEAAARRAARESGARVLRLGQKRILHAALALLSPPSHQLPSPPTMQQQQQSATTTTAERGTVNMPAATKLS